MIYVRFGTRPYGRVDEYAGEWADTTFFHVFWCPLFPTGGLWARGYGDVRFRVKMSARSVAATYLRFWGPVATLALFAAGMLGTPVLVGAAAAVALASGLSWRWRFLRGATAQRRSDLNYFAYGIRAEPSLWPADLRNKVRPALDAEWAQLASDRSPNEVARLGATSVRQAAIAYGLLRLVGASGGKGATEANADADAILRDKVLPASFAAGPYRVAATTRTDQSALDDLVNERIAQDPVRLPTGAGLLLRLKDRSRTQLLALCVGTAVALCGAVFAVLALKPVPTVKNASLDQVTYGDHVALQCDQLFKAFERTADGSVSEVISLCQLGPQFVPVMLTSSAVADSEQPIRIVGELKESAVSMQGDAQHELESVPELEGKLAPFYLDARDLGFHYAMGGFGILGAIVVPILWVAWLRGRRRIRALSATV